MKKGFTLVELSIVLVIIGLLIGGILIAQSMISTAKITMAISQIQQFDAGTEAFKSKFRYLPGDAPLFGGDGDGSIDRSANSLSDNAINVYACEMVSFWNNMDPDHYSASGYVTAAACAGANNGTTSNYSDTTARNVPSSKLGSKNSFWVVSAIGTGSSSYADITNRANYYAIMDGTQLQTPGVVFFTTTTSANSAVTPSDLFGLDGKIDDGIANTGKVLSGSINANRTLYSAPLATCSSGATYATSNSGFECTPMIRIGVMAGDPS